VKEIKLGRSGKYAIVDDCDYDWISQQKWHCNPDGYAVRNEWHNRKCSTISMHRVIVDTPKGMLTDHINHDILDNRRSNLRVCSSSQNHINLKMTFNKTSGIRGVSWDKKSNKWHSQIELDGKKYHLGFYKDIESARDAYSRKSIELHGEFAYQGTEAE
jgi:predicted P-loop ATPase